MLDHLPANNSVEVVKAGGIVIEQTLIHDEHGAAFAENLVDLLHLVDEAGLGERTLFGLKAGLVVFSHNNCAGGTDLGSRLPDLCCRL
jgi:hypothetical protein